MLSVEGDTEMYLRVRQAASLVLILLGAMMLYRAYSVPERLDIYALIAKIQKNEISELTIESSEGEVVAVGREGQRWRADVSNIQQQSLLLDKATTLNENGVPAVAKVRDISSKNSMPWDVVRWLPLILSIAAGVFLGGVLLRKVFPSER